MGPHRRIEEASQMSVFLPPVSPSALTPSLNNAPHPLSPPTTLTRPPSHSPHLPPTHFKPMRQVNNIIEESLFWTSESIWKCDGRGAGVGYLWHPLSSWEQTSLGAAQADNTLGQRDLGICHTVLHVITWTDKLLPRGWLRNSASVLGLHSVQWQIAGWLFSGQVSFGVLQV